MKNKNFFILKGGKKKKNTLKKRKDKLSKRKTKKYSKKKTYKKKVSGLSTKINSLKNTLLRSVFIFQKFNSALESGNYNEFKQLALALPNNISLDDIYLKGKYGIKTFLYDRDKPFNDIHGRSLIFLAVENNDIEFLKILLKSMFKKTIYDYAYYYLVDDIIGAGLDPLILACHKGNEKAVELLLEHFIPFYLENSITQNLSQDLEMRAKKITPLIAAVDNGNIKIIKMLLDKGVDINKQGISGYTPLHIAVNQNNIEMVNLLLKKGADFNINTFVLSQKPIDIAVEKGYNDIIELLKQYEK